MNITQDSELIKEKTRLTKALADAREFKNKILKGEYVRTSEVQKAYDKIASNIKTKLLALPVKLATMLAGQEANAISEILTENIHEVLKEFAEGKLL